VHKQGGKFKVRNAIRNAVRHLVNLPVHYIADDDLQETEGQGVVTDVSATGARINGGTLPVKRDEIVRLRFALHPTAPPVVLQAQVIWTTDAGFSVQFLNRDQLLMEALRLALCRS
jgi:hypothetical protein